jgi:hypothetical protein
MKKTLMLILFAVSGFLKIHAASITFINLTPCTFTFYSGVGTIPNQANPGQPYYFTFGNEIIGPGTTAYASPNMLPGFSTSAPPSLYSTGTYQVTKAIGPSGESFPIGIAPYALFISTTPPACNNSSNYTVSWNVNSSGNVVVLIS